MMTDHEVESRLREALVAVAATTTVDAHPVVPLEGATSPLRVPPRWRPMRAVAAGFIAAIVVFGALTLVPTSDTSETAPPSTVPVAAKNRFPVLGPLHSGSDVAAEITHSPEEPRYIKLVVGRESARGFSDAVTVIVWENDEWVRIPDGEPVLISEYDGILVRADPGDVPGAGATLFWYRGDRVLQVHDPQGSVDMVMRVAEAIDIDADATFARGALLVRSLPDELDILETPYESRSEFLPFLEVNDAGTSGLGRLTVTLSRSPSAAGAMALAGNAQAIDVRGVRGYVGLFGGATILLAWEEAPGVVVKIAADAEVANVDQLLSVADGLVFVDEATWRAVYPTAAGPDFPPTTTAS